MPAFNNHSIVYIDKPLNKVQFKVDTTYEVRHSEIPATFSISLDSFRTNTLIDSFYSQNFLETIEFKPDDFIVLDGLSIYTVLRRENSFDTINSANNYPEKLSTNIISQLDYISKRTIDTALRTYIADLRRYFH